LHATDKNDALLAIRCQLGESGAWEELVLGWHPRLWAFVSRMISDRGRAEDVLQTIWLRVVRSMGRLREPERLAPWLYGVARAAVADEFRTLYRAPPTEVLDETAQSDEPADRLAIIEAVEAGLSQLHPIDREAVVLHYLEELPLASVAEICGVPAGTIKSRLHRARRIMRETLCDEGVQT
jgi:RNA polymerase sigma-70 factor (ECF subfamily)